MPTDPLEAARRALSTGQKAALVTVVEARGTPPSRVGLMLTVTDDGTVYGSLGCDGFDEQGTGHGLESIRQGISVEHQYRWDDDSSIRVKVRPYAPGDVLPDSTVDFVELLVIGKGPVARALVALGEQMGYHVRVVAGPVPLDGSGNSSDAPGVGDFYGADEVIVAPDVRTVEALRPSTSTYVVICGHDEEFSQPALKALLRSAAPYLGIMGSRRHTGHLTEELRGEGYTDEEIARVHSPVGLDIGSETPEEIALSAIAHIVATRRGGSGRPLDEDR